VKLLKLCRNHWDRTVAIALMLGAAVALVGGWIGASDTVLTFEQIPYLISGGLAAVCLTVVGATLWLSADVRDEWRKLDELEEAVREIDVRSNGHEPLGRGGSAVSGGGQPLQVSER